MSISGYSLIDHLQRTVLNGFAGYGIGSVAGLNPKTTAKVTAVATLLFPLILVTYSVMVQWNLNPFRIYRLVVYSGQLTAIYACRHHNVISLRSTLILNCIAFLNYSL